MKGYEFFQEANVLYKNDLTLSDYVWIFFKYW